jgi:broad specificity phosphatase PhoE
LAAGRVVLIRHGESEWNAVGRWQGHSDVGLSPLGRCQAARTAVVLAEHEPDICMVASSDLMRVTETAVPAARALGLDLHVDRRLREIDVGWWGGLTTAQIEARDPGTFAAYRVGEDVPRGGAETEGQLRARVTVAVEELRASCDTGTLLVFCHGGPIRSVVAEALGLPANPRPQLAGPDNCSRTVLAHRDGTARLCSYNETAHLLDLQRSGASGDDTVEDSRPCHPGNRA